MKAKASDTIGGLITKHLQENTDLIKDGVLIRLHGYCRAFSKACDTEQFMENLKKALALLKLPNDIRQRFKPKMLASVVHIAYTHIRNALILLKKKIQVGSKVVLSKEWLKESYVVTAILGNSRVRLKTPGGDHLIGCYSPDTLVVIS